MYRVNVMGIFWDNVSRKYRIEKHFKNLEENIFFFSSTHTLNEPKRGVLRN